MQASLDLQRLFQRERIRRLGASPFNLFFLSWMFASPFMPIPRLCQPKAA
jgi:hypothetical protein